MSDKDKVLNYMLIIQYFKVLGNKANKLMVLMYGLTGMNIKVNGAVGKWVEMGILKLKKLARF